MYIMTCLLTCDQSVWHVLYILTTFRDVRNKTHFPAFFYWPIIPGINLFPCLSHSFGTLSSIIASLLSSLPTCFLCASPSKSSSLHVTFQHSIPEPHPAKPFLLCAFCVQPFLRPSLHPAYSRSTSSLSRRLLCKESSPPDGAPPPLPFMLPHRPGDLLKLYECGHIQGHE